MLEWKRWPDIWSLGSSILKQPAYGDKAAKASEFFLNPAYTDRILYDTVHSVSPYTLTSAKAAMKLHCFTVLPYWVTSLWATSGIASIRFPKKVKVGKKCFMLGWLLSWSENKSSDAINV